MTPSRDISCLLDIMAQLRNPGSGCPWDLDQDFSTIAPYTIEEAYEVADAIARHDLDDLRAELGALLLQGACHAPREGRHDLDDLRDELGDLLLQVVFHARMAEEQGAFDFGGVVEAITGKLVRRHPHVFGEVRGLSAEAVTDLWHDIKAQEKAAKATRGGTDEGHDGTLAGVPVTLPALTRA